MNYIKELNAFREFLLVNELPTSAIALWYTLMSINNVTRWKQTFNAPNGIVEQLSGLSRQGVLDARNKLIEHELIRCEKGRKGRAPVYEILSLVDADISSDKQLDTSHDLSAGPSLTIHKQKQNKIKRREEAPGPSGIFKTYEQNIGNLSPLTKKELTAWVNEKGEEIVHEAIRLACKHNGRTYRYVERILMEWKMAYLHTVEAVITYENKKVSLKNKTIPFRRQSLFDELRKEVSK